MRFQLNNRVSKLILFPSYVSKLAIIFLTTYFTHKSPKLSFLAINLKIQQCWPHITWSLKVPKWNKEYTKSVLTCTWVETMNQIQKIWKEWWLHVKQNSSMTKKVFYPRPISILSDFYQVNQPIYHTHMPRQCSTAPIYHTNVLDFHNNLTFRFDMDVYVENGRRIQIVQNCVWPGLGIKQSEHNVDDTSICYHYYRRSAQ